VTEASVPVQAAGAAAPAENAAPEEAASVHGPVDQPEASVRMTLHDANQLLAQARYEEALRAFLALSRQEN